jgi:RIO kinase 2
MGRTSFKNIKNLRSFQGDRKHISWLYVNRLAARREFEALSKIYKLKLNTPKPIVFNRHLVVMSYLRGKELAYIQDIKKPSNVFNKIIKQVKIIYQKANMIHGDLGEFNIVLDHKDNILIIDWLQWIPSDHPNAKSLLERDVENVCSFFKKKYHVESNPAEIIQSFYKS